MTCFYSAYFWFKEKKITNSSFVLSGNCLEN